MYDMVKKERMRNFEMNVYKSLGIEKFQEAVFLLEKIIHYNDKGKNTNYHIKNNHRENTENFKKYLFYNGSIHLRNAIVLICSLSIKIIFFKTSMAFSIFLLLFLTKDIYCIMLQRYNYLRIEKYLNMKAKHDKKRIEAKKVKLEKTDQLTNSKVISKSVGEIEQQKKLITNFRDYLNNTANVYLDNSNIEQLNQLKEFIIMYNSIDSKSEISEKSQVYLKRVRSDIYE